MRMLKPDKTHKVTDTYINNITGKLRYSSKTTLSKTFAEASMVALYYYIHFPFNTSLEAFL